MLDFGRCADILPSDASKMPVSRPRASNRPRRDSRSVNNARGSLRQLRVLDPRHLSLQVLYFCCGRREESRRWGPRVPPRPRRWVPKSAPVGSFFASRAYLGRSWALLGGLPWTSPPFKRVMLIAMLGKYGATRVSVIVPSASHAFLYVFVCFLLRC